MASKPVTIKTGGMKEYSRLNELPKGKAENHFIHGCAVFEGGGWRGVYTQGVIDELMIQGINLDCSIGVSAGALMSVNYLTGQIGRGPYITLKYRHDSRQWRKPNSRFTPYFLFGRKRGSCSFRKRKKAPVRKRIVNF